MGFEKVLSYTEKKLIPARNNMQDARTDTCNLVASTTYQRGQTLARLTSGPNSGKFDKRVTTKATDPAGAPVPTEGAAGTLGAGAYSLAYAYVTPNGKTKIAPVAAVTIAGSKQIAVAAITPLPAGVTSVDWFMSVAAGSSVLAFIANNNGAAFSINALPAAGAATPPAANTAFTGTNGSHKAAGLLMFDCITSADGLIYRANVVGGVGNPGFDEVQYYYAGEFLEADLIGFDDDALADLGGRRLAPGLIRVP